MKTVKSLTDLKQIALTRGAAVEIGSTRYNSDGQKIAALPRKSEPKTEPISEPKVEPIREPAPAPTVNVDLAPVANAQERIGAMLAQAIASMPRPEPAKQHPWRFQINRNDKGLIESIDAFPTKE